ncbi:exopolysaccharide production repressor exox [Neorhizobium sp. P12A]|uniref:exopolysaccharide production repressor protein n=1 Tax=Neorhizobium sp. P12A TaxID=2268027 RepID=UPI0011F085BD|nr:exopolysaccharide production repressor protein [Neorhizobium sp. P12A]KAA0691444.1 exopolysaccharide production repressor exox [Neorhizobium sp. P12A]
MYAPRVFASMIGALLAFAVATYFLTQSLPRTLIETIICAILLQVGYFLGVLYLSWKETKARRARLGDGKTMGVSHTDDTSVGLPTSNMNRSEPLNR